MKIVIIIPTYNEHDNISMLIAALQDEFRRARDLRDQLQGVQEKLSEAGRAMEGPEIEVDPAAPPSVQRLQGRAASIISRNMVVSRPSATDGATALSVSSKKLAIFRALSRSSTAVAGNLAGLVLIEPRVQIEGVFSFAPSTATGDQSIQRVSSQASRAARSD